MYSYSEKNTLINQTEDVLLNIKTETVQRINLKRVDFFTVAKRPLLANVTFIKIDFLRHGNCESIHNLGWSDTLIKIGRLKCVKVLRVDCSVYCY